MPELGTETLPPHDPTGDVVTHVSDVQGARGEREEVVKRDDSVRLGGGHRQALADIVEGTRRDPAKARLDGVERGQKEIAAGSRLVAAQQRRMALVFHVPSTPRPGRRRRSQNGIDDGALGCRRIGAMKVKVHCLR
jgi:hypothetical protein